MQQELLNWISKQKNLLDEIIAKTADTYLENHKNIHSNLIFDIQEANQEKYALSKGKDLCYDRPTTGFVYSLWYHGRRINTFLSYLINVFYENQEKEVAIFDLGAGTGAVQWAVGLIYAGMKALNISIPKLKIINIDNSPFMLHYHRLLWEQFLIDYSECSDINWEYRKHERLEGSYRLPYRISECIRELSKRIMLKHKDGRDISPNEITPYKSSPPGARPIVVFAKNLDSISKKIQEIFETYREAYGLRKITILEKDQKLCSSLRKLKIDAETDTILRIKGLEKECVLWSVRKKVENEKEAEEIVYTILTRTSSILIIAFQKKLPLFIKK